jgi:hypothetical protein
MKNAAARIGWFIRIAIGIFVGMTAFLKLHAVLTDPFADLKLGFPFTVLWLAIFVELGAVAVNVFWRDGGPFWLTHFALFTTLFVVAAVRASLGYADCGCLGAFTAPAWGMAVVDAAIIAGLLASLRNPTVASRARSTFDGATRFLKRRRGSAFGALAALVIVVVSSMYFESSDSAMARWVRGVKIVDPRVQVLPFPVGATQVVDVSIANPLPESIHVLGGSGSCSCVKLVEPVKELFPQRRTVVRFSVSSRRSGPWRQRFVLYLNSASQPCVFVHFAGEATNRPTVVVFWRDSVHRLISSWPFL